MKNIFFLFFIVFTLSHNTSFGKGGNTLDLVRFNKNDIVDYWFLKQLAQKYGVNDFLIKKICYSLTSYKVKTPIKIADLPSDAAYLTDKNIPISNCWITFNYVVPKNIHDSFFSENQLLSSDGFIEFNFIHWGIDAYTKLHEPIIHAMGSMGRIIDTTLSDERKYLPSQKNNTSSSIYFGWANPEDFD